MNKKLLFTLGIIVLVVLGYFALQEETPQPDTMFHLDEMQPHAMEQSPNAELEIYKEAVAISFQESYSIDDDWSLKIIQFEPNAKIEGQGLISSDSDQELNPAVKVNFYKNGDLIHYQISYKEMPGFHSIKPEQKYLLELVDYDGYHVLEDNKYSIENANVQIWIIK